MKKRRCGQFMITVLCKKAIINKGLGCSPYSLCWSSTLYRLLHVLFSFSSAPLYSSNVHSIPLNAMDGHIIDNVYRCPYALMNMESNATLIIKPSDSLSLYICFSVCLTHGHSCCKRSCASLLWEEDSQVETSSVDCLYLCWQFDFCLSNESPVDILKHSNGPIQDNHD